MELIDIGVNFHSPQLVRRHELILTRAEQTGVTQMLAIGTSLHASQLAVEISRDYPTRIFATAGIHPHRANEFSNNILNELHALWVLPEVVAVGECGLDYNRNFSTPAEQRRAFAAQLEAAQSVGKPLYLHCRDAFEDFIAMLAPYVSRGLKGVVHCFTGNTEHAHAFLDLGLDIGITGWITDQKRGQELRNAVSTLPLERIHLETDAPYLSPKNNPQRISWNEPANLPWVVQEIAMLTDSCTEHLASVCTANSRALFKLPICNAQE